MIGVAILAAGRSTRMGQSKPLLPYGEPSAHTFVSQLLEVVAKAGLTDIIVVGRPEDSPLKAEVARCAGTFVENPRSRDGQLSSLLAGLANLEDRHGGQLDAIVVIPVDAPLITPAVLTRLVGAAATSTAQILRATHAGRHGHPVLFRRSTFDELREADPAVGARAVVRADLSRVEDVEMDDEGVTIDFDTPDEYRRYFGRSPSDSR